MATDGEEALAPHRVADMTAIQGDRVRSASSLLTECDSGEERDANTRGGNFFHGEA
jgi:hypothetical protein